MVSEMIYSQSQSIQSSDCLILSSQGKLIHGYAPDIIHHIPLIANPMVAICPEVMILEYLGYSKPDASIYQAVLPGGGT